MYLVQCGYKNVISTLNTNISRKQLTKILNFKKIIFCFDNDEKTKAGQNAVLKHASDILISHQICRYMVLNCQLVKTQMNVRQMK